MSVTLDEYLRAIDSIARSGDDGRERIAPVLRQLATELVDLRGRRLGMLVEDTGAHEERLTKIEAEVQRVNERLVKLDAEVSRIDKRFDTQAVFARDRFSDLQAQVNANDAHTTTLAARFNDRDAGERLVNRNICQRLDRLEQYGGFGEVPGRTLPHPLPKWTMCAMRRTANSVAVSGYSDALQERLFSLSNTYTFDDFEEAGRFVATVLTQKPPALNAAQQEQSR